jgi:hypothetical protein
MSSVNDCKHIALGDQGFTQAHINDRFLAYLKSGGATSNNINDAQHEFLTAQGVATDPPSLNDRWRLFLISAGGDPSWSLNDLLQWFWCVQGGSVGPNPNNPDFHSLYPDSSGVMQGVLKGVGDLTSEYAGGNVIYAPDINGVYRPHQSPTPVWEGGTYARNVLLSSDFTTWQHNELPVTAPNAVAVDGGMTATTVVQNPGEQLRLFTGAGGMLGPYQATPGVNVFWIKKEAAGAAIHRVSMGAVGHHDRRVYLDPVTGGWMFGTSPPPDPSTMPVVVEDWGAWWCFRLGADWYNQSDMRPQIRIGVSSNLDAVEDFPGGTCTLEVECLSDMTVEDCAYMPPSRNSGVRTTRYYAVQFTGPGQSTSLPEIPYLKYQPAATNHCTKNSRDFGVWLWSSGTGSTSAVTGIDGTITGTRIDGTGQGIGLQLYEANISATLATGGAPSTFVIYVKATTGASVFPRIRPQFQSPVISEDIEINTNDGTLTRMAGTMTADVRESVRVGEWWRVMAQYTPSQETNTAFVFLPWDGVNDWDGFHVFNGKTIAEVRGLGPIFTTTAAASTDETIYSFDSLNHNDTGGAYYWEMDIPATDTVHAGALRQSYIGSGNALAWFYSPNVGSISGLRLRDTANSNAVIAASLAGAHKLAGVYMTGENLSPNVDGVFGNELAYSGAFQALSGGLIVGAGDVAALFRNLRRYDITSYAEGKQIIDELMA